MVKGSVDATSWKRKLLAFVLAAVILVCAVLLVVGNLDKPWTVGAQVLSAIAGAALGSILSVDSSRQAVRNQARPAIRRKFDQILRLRVMVVRTEGQVDSIRNAAVRGGTHDPNRVADWLENMADNLRSEIQSTATSIEDWGDLAQDVYDDEFRRYETRGSRMPTASTGNEVEK
ncbi:hypothetical protein QRX60_39430 [Amycolatopsis mongoliensis]|uniref:Uncharacterized protein n=1 Tax=Amycolatopsis mongoliensis TaxID=715475 RepID=A0A9Y2NHU7_9PSEU|nr:hypothetical protein [Amycolatopsis sp. 4-36]WIY00078.1 hypothetical protein QRX60_39430 [Amycolatopsis sp. 4-36]